MSVLHVACLPFPSPQGSQAAIAAMLRAAATAGRDHRLLVYGEGGPTEPGLPIDRAPSLPWRAGMRSGPSLAKLALDLAMVATLVRRAPALVLAHNVEAAWVATLAGVPFVYVAHTSMRAELPTYAHRGHVPLTALGGWLDRGSLLRARAVGAVSPLLAAELDRRYAVAARHLPVPWNVPPATTSDERRAARRVLGLPDASTVVLYAGNLDAYQGLPHGLEAMRRLPGSLAPTLLVATESDATELRGAAHAKGVALVVAGLRDEAARRRAHAAADVALVPRTIPGGLPIKLLESLARGVPTVASRTAAAGLPLDGTALLVRDADPEALATALRFALAEGSRSELSARGRAYVATYHSPARFLAACDRLLEDANRG